MCKEAAVDAVDEEGCTPLHKCAFTGYPDCLEILLKKGGSLHARDKTGATPLHKAAHAGPKACIEVIA